MHETISTLLAVFNSGHKEHQTLDNKPSVDQITSLQSAFDYFNTTLFQNSLPQVILNFSRSGAKTIAFYAPSRWEQKGHEPSDGKPLDEISLTPKYLGRTYEKIFSSLVHEQCHLWQFTHGNPSRSGYHNREWAKKMKEVGLQPDDGNGKETGQSVSHRIMDDRPFMKAFQAMPENFKLPWRVFIEGNADVPKKTKTRNRVKYTCSACGSNVWGKPSLEIVCRGCNTLFLENG